MRRRHLLKSASVATLVTMLSRYRLAAQPRPDKCSGRAGWPAHIYNSASTWGDFVYSDAEFALIQQDLEHARSLGVSGFVAGVLRPDRTVDGNRMRLLVEQATPLEVTFHRSFDVVADLEHALEDVIATGCRRLLTSGGAGNVYIGAERLRRLGVQADERIAIAVGGGLRL